MERCFADLASLTSPRRTQSVRVGVVHERPETSSGTVAKITGWPQQGQNEY